MLVLAVVCFPLLLMLLLMCMDRVERPLRDETLGERIAATLDDARPDEVERMVSQNTAATLDRYWHRRGRDRVFLAHTDSRG